MKTIRAITLDLDDTLWPVGPTIMRAEKKTQAWLAERAPEVVQQWPSEKLRALRMEIHESRAELRHDLLQVRRLALAHAFDACGLRGEHYIRVIEDALEVFMRARNEVELYPEVAECLARLSQRYPLASLTNGNANLTVIGLDHLFRAKVSAHEHGTSKPDPALFHIACRALGCAPNEVVHVGDDPDLDVRGARAAGLHAVWINRENTIWPTESGDAPPAVSDLEAFECLLDEL